jgi:hypothetical protein
MSEAYHATYNKKDEGGNILESQELTAEYDFGSNTQEAVELFGEEVVFSTFKAQAVVKLQSVMRSAAKAGKDVQEVVNAWKPGVARVRGKSPVEKALSAFGKMSPEEQQAFIASLQAQASKG